MQCPAQAVNTSKIYLALFTEEDPRIGFSCSGILITSISFELDAVFETPYGMNSNPNFKDADKFSDLARLYSDDPGSKMEGGELSWTGPGRFDPKFEEVMDSLEINQVSKPFKSNFGWHIVEVLDRREEDISLNIQKNRAYQILFDRKYEEQLEKTLSEMRAESYVNIKIKS